MRCPSCGFETEEKTPDCPKCRIIYGKWFEKKAREAEGVNIQMPKAPATEKEGALLKYVLFVLIGFALIIVIAIIVQPKREKQTGSADKASASAEKTALISGGERVDIGAFAVRGKITIFDFYADWCGPCRVMAPKIEEMVSSDPDVYLRKINIVTWDSDVSKQYVVQFVPNIRVYGRDGVMIGKPTSNIKNVKEYVNSAK